MQSNGKKNRGSPTERRIESFGETRELHLLREKPSSNFYLRRSVFDNPREQLPGTFGVMQRISIVGISMKIQLKE